MAEMATKDELKQDLKKLDVQKQSLETEAEAIVSELNAPNIADDGTTSAVAPMGVDTPLVDADGYPRSDIDIVRARTLRKRLAEIRTDHKDLMKMIDNGLMQLNTLSVRRRRLALLFG